MECSAAFPTIGMTMTCAYTSQPTMNTPSRESAGSKRRVSEERCQLTLERVHWWVMTCAHTTHYDNHLGVTAGSKMRCPVLPPRG